MRKLATTIATIALAGCAYQAPPDLTPQAGASLSGLFDPTPGPSRYVAVCAELIDGRVVQGNFGPTHNDCHAPVLLSPGQHTLNLDSYFNQRFGSANGSTNVTANFAAGMSYYIRANGGPTQFHNSNGVLSTPSEGASEVWIESSTGEPITPKLSITLDSPTGSNAALMLPMIPILLSK